MKLRRIFFLGGAFFVILLKFALDVVAKSVEFDWGSLAVLRELAVAAGFTILYFLIKPLVGKPGENPVRKLGFLLILTTVILLLIAGATSISLSGFDAKGLSLTPIDYATLFVGSLVSLFLGLFGLIVFAVLANLLRYGRRKGARRNALIFITLIAATSASAIALRPLDSSTVTTILFATALVMAVVNSFRLPWIIELSKREKVFSLIYTFFLFILLTATSVAIAQVTFIHRSILFYSVPLKFFVQISTIFGAMYSGMAFVSTLFHLPTAEAFERKKTEVSSLHNLSRLITQVLDFNELVDTVTTMTLDVCGAKTSWLEIVRPSLPDAGEDSVGEEFRRASKTPSGMLVYVAGKKNITEEEIEQLVPAEQRSVRDDVLEQRKPVVIDDLRSDSRFRRSARGGGGSLVAVPLLSHGDPIGLLFATKDTEFGFVRDDVDVISAFADQATVAIENSRLIKKSIERERLVREMNLARDMQKKLLPQKLPTAEQVDIDAISTPAFEVGGDYYDFVHLDEERIGIVVGDVSGKGVSAAFYMSEVKGIFLALAAMYSSPREFLIRANEALAGSIDKHSFVSLIYAILNVRTGTIQLARAGHCPMLHVSRDSVQHIRPDGLGLGLTERPLFAEVIEEYSVQLHAGDICLFYTDGVTEARVNGEEYGTERLVAAVQRLRSRKASIIKEEILGDVRTFVGGEGAHHDDLTLVVVKWGAEGR